MVDLIFEIAAVTIAILATVFLASMTTYIIISLFQELKQKNNMEWFMTGLAVGIIVLALLGEDV